MSRDTTFGRDRDALNAVAPFDDAQVVTPDDDADVIWASTPAAGAFRGLLVGTTGDVCVVMVSGAEVVWPSLVAGVVHPIRGTRIKETGTTADDIVVGR